MANNEERITDPGKAPFAAVADALRYPLGNAALLTNIVLIGCHLLAMVLPVLGGPLHLFTWLWLYKYALEVLTATGAGRADPPEGWSEVEEGLHHRHMWLQLLFLVALLLATQWAPQALRPWLVASLALVMPAAVLSLAVAQNLIAALNPLHWLRVSGLLGVGYLWLALACWGVLWFQTASGRFLEDMTPGLIVIPLYYAAAQHLILSVFRLLGLSLHAHSVALGFRQGDHSSRPTNSRDNDETAKREWGEQALQEPDPAKRAANLALLLPRGVHEELHREYRQCLLSLGDHAGLQDHARMRTCSLLVLEQPRAAITLTLEALAHDPGFALPDAPSSLSWSLAAEQMGLLRQAAQILDNYRQAYPRRYDGLPLALRAATLFADRLQQPDSARRVLRSAQPMAAPGEESDAFKGAIERLEAGKPLLAATPGIP